MTDPSEQAEIGLDGALVDLLDRASPMQTSIRAKDLSSSFHLRRWDAPIQNLKAIEGAISASQTQKAHTYISVSSSKKSSSEATTPSWGEIIEDRSVWGGLGASKLS